MNWGVGTYLNILRSRQKKMKNFFQIYIEIACILSQNSQDKSICRNMFHGPDQTSMYIHILTGKFSVGHFAWFNHLRKRILKKWYFIWKHWYAASRVNDLMDTGSHIFILISTSHLFYLKWWVIKIRSIKNYPIWYISQK